MRFTMHTRFARAVISYLPILYQKWKSEMESKETIDFYLPNCYTVFNGGKWRERKYPVVNQMNI